MDCQKTDDRADFVLDKTKRIIVRWCDGYKEIFYYSEFRAGNYYLWIMRQNGTDRWIPLSQVRTFSVEPVDKMKE